MKEGKKTSGSEQKTSAKGQKSGGGGGGASGTPSKHPQRGSSSKNSSSGGGGGFLGIFLASSILILALIGYGFVNRHPLVIGLYEKVSPHLPSTVVNFLERASRSSLASSNLGWVEVPDEHGISRTPDGAILDEPTAVEWPGECQVFPSGHDHINNDTFVPFRYNPDNTEIVSKLTTASVAAQLGLNYPNAPHKYLLYNEQGVAVKSFADCKKLHGYLYLLREGDLWVWPAISFFNKVRVDFKEEDANGVMRNRHLILETLAGRPHLFFIKNFIKEDERVALVNAANQRLQRSTVHSSKGDYAENSRTSENAWVFSSESKMFEDLDVRISKVLRIPEELVPDAGATQVLRYLPGQYYHVHHDGFTEDKKDSNIFLRYRRNRFATVLYYLSDVEEGGETNFPSVNQTDPYKHEYTCSQGMNVKPISNGAVVFYSLEAYDSQAAVLDPWAYHAACKVKAGTKWAANRWIYNKMRPSDEIMAQYESDPKSAPYGYNYQIKI